MNLILSFEPKFPASFYAGISLLFLGLFPFFFSAQTSVSGHVYSSSYSPVVGASLYSHSYKIGATTDSSGYFIVEGFPDAISSTLQITLHISSLGFKTMRVKTNTGALNLVVLLKDDVMNLDEVVIEEDVSQSQKTCLVKIASMSVEQLDRTSYPSRIQALALNPGVDMISSGGGVIKPVIRGLSGVRVITLLRGTRVESQAWGAEHGIYLPEQGIDRVEIIRGPGALAFGSDAIGGVLNFIPENPLTEIGRESTLSLRGFSATSGLQASLATKKRSRHSHHAFSGGYNSHGDYRLPNGELAPNSFYHQFFGQGVWGYIKEWGKIDGAYSSSYNTAGLLGSEGFQQSGDHILTSTATIYTGGLIVKPTLSYQLNHRKEFEHPRNPDTTSDSLGLPPFESEPDLDLALRSYRYGATVEKNGESFEVTLGLSGVSTTNTNELPQAPFIPDASMNESSAFAISSFDLGTLNIIAGSRFDVISVNAPDVFVSNSYATPSFSVGAIYDIQSADKSKAKSDIRLSYSLGNRAPGLTELTADGIHDGAYRYEVGNSDLGVESSHNLDLAYSLSSSNFTLEAAVFYNSIQDFIHLENEGYEIEEFPVYHFTSSDAILKGTELAVSYSPERLKALSFQSALSIISGTVSEGSLPFIPPTNLRSTITLQPNSQSGIGSGIGSGFFASISSSLVAETTIDNFYSPAYSVFDFATGSEISDRLVWGLTCSNIFNTQYIPHLSLSRELGIANPGRNLGLRLSFKL